MEAVGTADKDFLDGVISYLQVVNTPEGEFEKRGLDFMLSVVKGLKPRDQVEAMLGAQMAAVHVASMRLACRLASAINVLEVDSAERTFIKLIRAFASQIECLKRYRGDGPQTVENVSVADGGQAVIGNVTHSPSETTRSDAVASRPLPAKANGRGFPIRPTKERMSLRPNKERIADRAGPQH
jgi:hypothetical protein